MRRSTAGLLLTFALMFAAAAKAGESLVIAPPTAHSSGCDLADVKIKDKAGFLAFFNQLHAAAVGGKRDALVQLLRYPFRLKLDGKLTRFGTPAELEARFDEVFTAKVLAAIRAQTVATLFCNLQGVRIGDGEAWIGMALVKGTTAQKLEFKVKAINP